MVFSAYKNTISIAIFLKFIFFSKGQRQLEARFFGIRNTKLCPHRVFISGNRKISQISRFVFRRSGIFISKIGFFQFSELFIRGIRIFQIWIMILMIGFFISEIILYYRSKISYFSRIMSGSEFVCDFFQLYLRREGVGRFGFQRFSSLISLFC